jgi:hypothetical protein
MIDMRWGTVATGVLAAGLGCLVGLGCHGAAQTAAPASAAAPAVAGEPRATTRQAQVVSSDEAPDHGMPVSLAIPFATGRDGTKLVADFLARADAARAERVADLAIIIQTRRDEQLIECRSEIVPEAVTSARWGPSPGRLVPLDPLVTRTVTEWVYQCRPVTHTETRSRIENEDRCVPVTRVVPTSAAAFSDSAGGRTTVLPTDFYLEYRTVQECKKVPVLRTRSELVTETHCAPELMTREVTRHEFQLEQEYIPGHFEAFTRQRLRELEPVCYTPDPPASSQAEHNRIQGLLFGIKPRR